jgi:hypothetical protein
LTGGACIYRKPTIPPIKREGKGVGGRNFGMNKKHFKRSTLLGFHFVKQGGIGYSKRM